MADNETIPVQLTLADFEGADAEAGLTGEVSADAHALGDRLFAAARAAEAAGYVDVRARSRMAIGWRLRLWRLPFQTAGSG